MRAMGHTLVAEARPRNGCAPSRVSYGPAMAIAEASYLVKTLDFKKKKKTCSSARCGTNGAT